ncbi:hypothetical protein D3C80_1437580 [compost metagenome]
MGATTTHTDAPSAVPYAYAFDLQLLYPLSGIPWQTTLDRFVLAGCVIVILYVHAVEVIRLIRHGEIVLQRFKHDLRVINVVERRPSRFIPHRN